MEVLLEGKTPGGRATARAARSRGEGCREPGPGQIAAGPVNAQRPLSIRELMATSPLVGSELRPEPDFWPLSRKSVLSSHWELVRLSLLLEVQNSPLEAIAFIFANQMPGF